jgi:hypothetical protein
MKEKKTVKKKVEAGTKTEKKEPKNEVHAVATILEMC